VRQRCRPPSATPARHGPHVREAQTDIHADPPDRFPERLRRLGFGDCSIDTTDYHFRFLPESRTRPSRSEVALYVTEATLGGRAPLATSVRSVARPIRRSAPRPDESNGVPNARTDRRLRVAPNAGLEVTRRSPRSLGSCSTGLVGVRRTPRSKNKRRFTRCQRTRIGSSLGHETRWPGAA
jgi:hypothetical protein